MSTYRLDKLFRPASLALVGASPRALSLGRAVLKNLLTSGFSGPIHLVNPRHSIIEGVATVKSLTDISDAPDLIIITAPPAQVPGIIAEAGVKGCSVAIILSAGLGHGPGSYSEAVALAARAHGVRLIGPNCLGVLVPPAKVNASFAAQLPQSGDLALISQSGAVAAGLVEWAAQQGLGFSGIVSVGDQIDVDFADLLDYFALDSKTRAILLYVESISDARKFMSAARAAARVKPVVVIKSGRHALGAKAAATHTGALAGSDAVYDAAFRRAGLLRVFDLDELFSAAEMLARVKPFEGQRLAILTNGGGIGVLAVDRLIDLGGKLAELSSTTIQHLDAVLPKIWSRANPIDIAGDANAMRYRTALEALIDDPENDAVMVMHVTTALASPQESAAVVADVVTDRRSRATLPKPTLAVWVAEDNASAAIFDNANIPHFTSEAAGIAGFMHAVRYNEARVSLLATPPSLPKDFLPNTAKAQQIVRKAVADGRAWLNPLEIAELLGAYGIPIVPALFARNPEEAAAVSHSLLSAGMPVVAKILSPDIVHKSEVGGVVLNLMTKDGVRRATEEILARARFARPDARIEGVTIHPMILRPKARELIAGLADDPTFGPVIVFGAGGTAVEVVNDKALALPPLDLNMARALIARTRVSRLLKAYRDIPAADEAALALLLVKLAQLAADVPDIRELDLNPVLADSDSVLAVDARIAVRPIDAVRVRNPLTIRPYPKDWERSGKLLDGRTVFMRPVKPEDESLFLEFLHHVTPEDLRLRFFAHIKEFSHTFIARLTQIDYARSMCFIALDPQTGSMMGVVRLHSDARYLIGEFAILVRSDHKGCGLGWLLMQMIVDYATAEGIHTITGTVLRENTTMLAMCQEFGFSITSVQDEVGVMTVNRTVSS